jgi:hypothetical protein
MPVCKEVCDILSGLQVLLGTRTSTNELVPPIVSLFYPHAEFHSFSSSREAIFIVQ